MEWRIGCSGFHYRHWKGKFYPQDLPQRKWFDFYCEHFNTLELNVTFYRFPQLSFLQGWHAKSPDSFRFAVKAPRAITHYKKFNAVHDLLSSFYDTINNGLQAKLGPLLFQLPPSFSYAEERLERIINSLSPAFNNVLEFRHPSWWQKNVYDSLTAKHIAFCSMSHPALPDNIVQNTNIVYYRFHGVPELYRSPYSKEFLNKVISTIKVNTSITEGWFYFNNDVDVAAIYNAKEMISMIK